MTVVEKPPLDEALLIHYGKKGMKWGVRNKRPDEAERKARFSPKTKKIAAGVAVAAGAAAALYLLSRNGKMPVSQLGVGKANLNPTASQKLNELRRQQGENFANKLKSNTMNQTLHFDTKKNTWDVGQSVSNSRDLVRRAGSRSSGSQKANRINLGDINAVKNAMSDPNFVWDL